MLARSGSSSVRSYMHLCVPAISLREEVVPWLLRVHVSAVALQGQNGPHT